MSFRSRGGAGCRIEQALLACFSPRASLSIRKVALSALAGWVLLLPVGGYARAADLAVQGGVEAASPPVQPSLKLGVRQALQEVLGRATSVLTQKLDIDLQTQQARLASHEFLPQTTLTGQFDRTDATAAGLNAGSSRSTSGAVSTSWKLRTGTTLLASVGRTVVQSAVPMSTVPQEGVPATASGTTRMGTTTSSIGLTHPLLRGAGRELVTLAERQAALGLVSAQEGFVQGMTDVVFSCISSYFAVEQARRNVSLALATSARTQEVRRVNDALLAAGRIARTELLQNDADSAQAEFSLTQARQAETVARRELLRLIRYDDDVDPDRVSLELSDSFSDYLSQWRPEEGPMLQAAMANRVDLQLARDSVASSRLSLIAARDGLRNQLDVYAKLDHVASGHSVSSPSVNRGVGVLLTIALDKSSQQFALASAQAALEKAELALAEQVRTVTAGTRDALVNISFSEQQLRMAQRAAELAKQRLADEVEKARAGRSSATDLSFAQDGLRQASSQEVQAQYAVFTAKLELQRVTGTLLEQWQVDSVVRAMIPPTP